MKKLVAVVYKTFSVILLLIGYSAICHASQDIPESITFDQLQDLYEPVVFEHTMHADMLSCSNCHHHLKGIPEGENPCTKCHTQEAKKTEATCLNCHLPQPFIVPKNKKAQEPAFPLYHLDIPTLKGALHLQCVGCHRHDGGPTGCRECHAFTEKGEKRFRIKQ